MPADFSRILRNGGENIWASALTAASSMSKPLGAFNPRAGSLVAAGLRAQSGSGNVRSVPGTPLAMSKLTRRSFLAAAGAVAATQRLARPSRSRRAPGEPRSGVDVVDRRGRRRRHRRGAAGRRRRPQMRGAGSVGRGRRPLPHRYGAVRRALRSRRARASIRRKPTRSCALRLQSGFDIYPAPPGQRMRIARRYARESEMEDMLSAMVRANTAIAEVARKADIATAQALPKDLGEWRSTVEFMLGPYFCGKDVSETSAADLARAAERDVQAYCRQGLGAVIAKLAADCRCGCRRRPRASTGAAAPASRSRPRRGRSMPAPSSSRHRPMCSPPASCASRPTCRSG